MREALIVTRHLGLVEWLARRGIVGEVRAHVDDDDVGGRLVVGVLPLHLAARAWRIITVDMPGMPAERRGAEATPEEMDSWGARMTTYRVRRKK